jgi:zinc and cadmium transporter
MLTTVLYVIISVILVSLISLVGIVALSLKAAKLKKILIYLVSFSAGALFGGAFLHLLPELAEKGLTLKISFLTLGGILLFFIVEKVVHWNHCHISLSENHVHPFALMNLIGDGVHNFLDGLIIAATYLINIPLGIATTIAVALHEIPQEIGDFGVLVHGGFSKRKAIKWNLVSAVVAIIGAVIGLVASTLIENLEMIIVPIAIGGFIYIAGSDLIPELHKDCEHSRIGKALLQLLAFVIGIGVMALLLLIG